MDPTPLLLSYGDSSSVESYRCGAAPAHLIRTGPTVKEKMASVARTTIRYVEDNASHAHSAVPLRSSGFYKDVLREENGESSVLVAGQLTKRCGARNEAWCTVLQLCTTTAPEVEALGAKFCGAVNMAQEQDGIANFLMAMVFANVLDSTTYTKQNICDNTLDDAQLVTRCPLDNGRCIDASIAPHYFVGQLNRLPAELLRQVLLYLDLPSLTCFRRVNRRAMEIADSLPQYAAIVRHCPNIIRAIISIQADAFDCHTLYRILSTTRCSTCERFGDHLYLIDCRRVCYLCFTRRPEYFPLTIGRASSFYSPDKSRQHRAITSRQRLRAANPPRVLSLPGRYCTAWAGEGGNLVQKRLELFDRRAVVRGAGSGHSKVDKTTREPLRFMAIITAPYLFDSGLQVDWGYFCLGCEDEKCEETKHFRIKYTREGMKEHIERYGLVEETPKIPGRYMHVTQV
ncbi:uncharacterized protein PCL_12488 [Purpureocillium lilacinum]|uniref:F-box domain-containing protein n=1 Tax=Purpureocillium lilacinum TaxID=33203 RepID=A0A2U3E9D6_PURLI|nr:uncharacterized protein PCL_12488 [Purpureocillium lilacinum]